MSRTTHRVVVLGAGAAGASAARALAEAPEGASPDGASPDRASPDGASPDVDVTLVARTGETPYNRMLVKAVAHGQLTPELVRMHLPSATLLADSAQDVDTDARLVRLESGHRLPYDSLVVATGSRPRTLDHTVEGVAHAQRLGLVTTLHSLADAVHVRDSLAARDRPGRVICYGGGVTAAETASTLSRDGHHVTLVARSTVPGTRAFGADAAAVIADDHHAHLAATRFGRTVEAVHAREHGIDVHLDDGSVIAGDLLVVALGTLPSAPAPWRGAVPVDDRLRAQETGVYAAGGVAVHHDGLGTWRIDHWEDAVAQGAHAAAMVLAALGRAPDPGPYRPRSPFVAQVHGRTVAGAGLTTHASTRRSPSEQLTLHQHRDTVVGVSGVDAVAAVYRWSPHLHQASPS